MRTPLFDFRFGAGSALDVGLLRESNQDRVILCPKLGFFAVTDGMGGLTHGGKTAEIIAETLPAIVESAADENADLIDPRRAGEILKERVRMVSDNIYDVANKDYIGFGATLSSLWLIGDAAVYVNLGDSRGYRLRRYRRSISQITDDHNVAGELVRLKEITPEQAYDHPASNRLTRFMGMPAPADPDVFVARVSAGDRLLLCSDGLHGMLRDDEIRKILRSCKSPAKICQRLVDAANQAGGKDNISAVYVKIGSKKEE